MNAYASGYVPWSGPVLEPPAPVSISLDAGRAIAGHVLDLSGQGVPGARVTASIYPVSAVWPAAETFIVGGESANGSYVAAGRDGAFRLSGLRPGGTYYLRAEREGFATDEFKEPPLVESGASDAIVRLMRVSRVAIRVLDDASGDIVPVADYHLSTPGMRVVGPLYVAEPGARGALTPLWRNERRDVVLAQREGAETTEATAARILVRANPIGYEPIDHEEPFPFGSNVDVAVRARRRSGTAWVRVSPRAMLVSDRPFSGRLRLTVQESGGQSGSPLGLWCEFSEGESRQSYELPAGEYLVSPEGVGPTGDIWPVAGPDAHWALPASPNTARPAVQVRGNPIRLTVLDAAGRRVRFYHVTLGPVGVPGGVPIWDPIGGSGDARSSSDDCPWVSPAVETLTVSVGGWSSAPASIHPSGDGSVLSIDVRLAVPKRR